MLSVYEITKIGRNKNFLQKQQKREIQDNRGCRMNSARAVKSAARTKFCNARFFLNFLLFFPSGL